MIYIACAMYMEAAPFIRRFACKRDDSFHREQVFVGEEATVIITGTSPVPAAVALSEALALLAPGDEDIFANVGLCGCSDVSVEPGTLYLVNSILEHATGRSFYPDLPYTHKHPHGGLTTFSAVVKDCFGGAFLVDTEGAALYQAAIGHFTTDRMYFFKIVSDHGFDANKISPTVVSELLDRAAPDVSDTLLRFASYVPKKSRYTEDEEAVIDYFCRSLHCSVTMEHELRRLIQYYELERGNAIAHLREFFPLHGLDYEGDVLLRSRKEGKDVLEAFRNSCLC
ncbi:MAG: hypothetical protein J5649_06220 [Lachnospiraceae bacterium]|nr:hypothetical protein [Lachnospiraceae bacterium]